MKNSEHAKTMFNICFTCSHVNAHWHYEKPCGCSVRTLWPASFNKKHLYSCDAQSVRCTG